MSTRPGSLILTVTRDCNLRCSYCPTAKDGWPSLSIPDVQRAIDLFVDVYGGGDIKIFGGEPLLVPAVVRAAMEHAAQREGVRRVYLSTNGLGLTAEWLAFLRSYPKGILTLSMDGMPEDHRRMRRALPGVEDTYDRVMSMLPALLETPRLVVTQTIAPATAYRAADNFKHLLSLGFRRFNLLPGYYLPWRAAQLDALRSGFAAIQVEFERRWSVDRYIYLRNLFTWAPTPFFNTGLVVDADRSIHPSNVGLSGALDHLREQTRVGSLDNPPSLTELRAQTAVVNDVLADALPENIRHATAAVDAELTALCRALYPSFVAYRRRRRGAA